MGTSGEQAGRNNIHNRGGLTSVLFSRDGAAAPGAARWGWWPEGFLHEASHNLGAVQWGAPHSTQPLGQSLSRYGHCFQGADVMCYAEDGGARSQMVTDCAGLPGAIPQSYDCGRDDYFNPAPAAGSYLATHWNTYDSAFLAPCGEIAPACGGGNLWVPEAPAASVAPAVAGSPRRGSTMTAGAGTWSNGPTDYAYQWQRLVARRLGGHRGRDGRHLRGHERGSRSPPAGHGDRLEPGRQRQRRLRPDRADRRQRREPRGQLVELREGLRQGQQVQEGQEGLQGRQGEGRQLRQGEGQELKKKSKKARR